MTILLSHALTHETHAVHPEQIERMHNDHGILTFVYLRTQLEPIPVEGTIGELLMHISKQLEAQEAQDG